MTEQNATFWGMETRVGHMTHQIQTRARFLFNRLEAIMLTNKHTHKQTDATQNVHLALKFYAGG